METTFSDGAVLHPLQPEDLAAVAALHQRVFTESLLRYLGEVYLRSLYRGFLQSDDYQVVVHRNPAGLDGWVVVDLAPHQPDAQRLLRRRPAALAWAVLSALLRWPWVLPCFVAGLLAMARHRLREARLRPTASDGAPVASDSAATPTPAMIRYIAVAETARGQRVGQALLRAGEATAVRAGRTRMLVTTTADNTPALRLYQGLGYQVCRQWPGYDGRRFVQLGRDLG